MSKPSLPCATRSTIPTATSSIRSWARLADAVYCGLQNATNARNFPGLNFTIREFDETVAYAHAHNAKVLLAVNTFTPAGKFSIWSDAIDATARIGVDAVIVVDIGVIQYAARNHPQLRLHLSVQAGGSSPEAINFYCENFGVKRIVLPGF